MIAIQGVIGLNVYFIAGWILSLVTGGAWICVQGKCDRRLVDALVEDGIVSRKMARAQVGLRRPYRYLLPSLVMMNCLWFQGRVLVALPGAPAAVSDKFAERTRIADVGTPIFLALCVTVNYAKILWYRNILKEKQS